MVSASLSRSKSDYGETATISQYTEGGSWDKGEHCPVPALVRHTGNPTWGSPLYRTHVKQQCLAHVPPCAEGSVSKCSGEAATWTQGGPWGCRVTEMEEVEAWQEFLTEARADCTPLTMPAMWCNKILYYHCSYSSAASAGSGLGYPPCCGRAGLPWERDNCYFSQGQFWQPGHCVSLIT